MELKQSCVRSLSTLNEVYQNYLISKINQTQKIFFLNGAETRLRNDIVWALQALYAGLSNESQRGYSKRLHFQTDLSRAVPQRLMTPGIASR
jgi:hypothetical protein